MTPSGSALQEHLWGQTPTSLRKGLANFALEGVGEIPQGQGQGFWRVDGRGQLLQVLERWAI